MRFLVFFNRKYGLEIFFLNRLNLLKIICIVTLILFIFMKKSKFIIFSNMIMIFFIFSISN
ncbi:MAG: hypothetical protein ACRC6K_01315, partial [Fusobacteriaceae bacterium]